MCVCVYPGSYGSLLSPVCWCSVLLLESLQSYGSQLGGKSVRNSPSPPETPGKACMRTLFYAHKYSQVQTLHVPHASTSADTPCTCSLCHGFTITGMCFNSTIINSAGSHCCSFSLIFTRPSCSPSLSLEIPQLTQFTPTVGLSWGTSLVFLSTPLLKSLFCKFGFYIFFIFMSILLGPSGSSLLMLW